MTPSLVLLTGASGYLGRRVAHRYLEQSDVRLLLLVRTAQSRDEIVRDLGPLAARVEFVLGDLEAPECFADLARPTRRAITSIIHSAAVTRFNVDRSLAFRTNVDGTAQVLELARDCRALEAFGHVSSVYATGLRDGPVREELVHDGLDFANAYEESKCAAEQVVAAADDLPWRILRVATVLADDESGVVTQYNAVHDSLKLCFYGLLSLLPGRPGTPLYFVTGEFVTDAIVELMSPSVPGGIYHLAHERENAVTLSRFIDLAFTQFSAADDFRRKRILPPLLADRDSFSLLVDGISPIAGGLVTSALRDVAPYAPQLYVWKDLDNTRLRGALSSYTAPDPDQLVSDTCRHLVGTRWRRRDAVH